MLKQNCYNDKFYKLNVHIFHITYTKEWTMLKNQSCHFSYHLHTSNYSHCNFGECFLMCIHFFFCHITIFYLFYLLLYSLFYFILYCIYYYYYYLSHSMNYLMYMLNSCHTVIIQNIIIYLWVIIFL